MSEEDDYLRSWRELITDELSARGEDWSRVVFCTLPDGELDRKFDIGYGGTSGKPFTLWTYSRVYFPWCYDGAEGVASVPRNPCTEETEHVGG